MIKAQQRCAGKRDRRPVMAAAVASMLMLLLGGLYRLVVAQAGICLAAAPIDSDALQGIPLQMGEWMGEETPLDENVVRRTDTDTHINRRYSRDLQSVLLYLGCGTRTRDLIQHRPETCYVGAGWALMDRSLRELPLSDGSSLPCAILEFSRGDLNGTEKVVVLHYYLVDDRYCRTVSEWRYQFWRTAAVAQVQIVASVAEILKADEAARSACEFAITSAPFIAAQFEQVRRLQATGVASDEQARGAD